MAITLSRKRKVVIGLCSALAVTGTAIGYGRSQTEAPPKYVLAAVTRGSVIQSVSGSGQVSGEREYDVKPTVSGSVVSLKVKPGDTVTEGSIIAELDRTDAQTAVRNAQRSVRDAQLALDSQRLSYEKQKGPPDPSALLQAENAVKQAERDLAELLDGPEQSDVDNANRDIQTQLENTKTSYDRVLPVNVRTAYDNAVSVLLDAARLAKQSVHDTDSLVRSNDPNLSNLKPSSLSDAVALSHGLREDVTALDRTISGLTSTGADPAAVDAALNEAQATFEDLVAFLQKMDDVLLNTLPSSSYSQSAITTLKQTIDSDLSGCSSRLSSILTQKQGITQAKTSASTAAINLQKAQAALAKLMEPPSAAAVASAEEKLALTRTSLADLKSGISSVDVAIAENSLKQRQSSLAAAQSTLADAQKALGEYTVRAPFTGVVASVGLAVKDQASPSTVIATVLTDAKIATLSLNEVDAAKVKVGQKATLTFDALSDLNVAGIVSEVDAIGTASQGVVSYGVKIAFESQDERVKSGMSVTAQIVTDAKIDVLTLPNAAVKTTGGAATVSVLPGASPSDPAAFTQGVASDAPPETKAVETGAANDQVTEITSGLNEGDLVVLRVVASSKAAASTQTGSSSFRIPGMSTGGSGAAAPQGAVMYRR